MNPPPREPPRDPDGADTELSFDPETYHHYSEKIPNDEIRRQREFKNDFSEDIARRDADFKRLFKEAFKEWLSEQSKEVVALLGTGLLHFILGLLKMLLIAGVGSILFYYFKHAGWRTDELMQAVPQISPVVPHP